MTQQWGNQPGQGGQWPAQQNWNRPAQTWGAQPGPYGPQGQYGQPAQGQYGAPPQYGPGAGQPQRSPYPVPQPQFGRPGYGQPGAFPAPGGAYPPGGPRKSPFRGLLLGLVLVVGIAFFGIALMNYLNPATDTAGPRADQTATPPPTTAKVPPPDTNPPEIPQPETYSEATQWLEENKVYAQTAPVPTNCAVPEVDMTTASVAQLTSHLNELTGCLWTVWSGPLEAAGFQLPRPPVTVYTAPITTGCGTSDDHNASYCAADQRIYYSQNLWQILPPDQRRARFVIESVLAHEFGHTIQARTGILIASAAWEQKVSKSEGKVFSRRLETQADCLAGIFTSAVAASSGLTEADQVNLREVFYNIGDDVLSGEATIQGDHGLGRSRRAWFTTGQGSAEIGKCNTYVAAPSTVR